MIDIKGLKEYSIPKDFLQAYLLVLCFFLRAINVVREHEGMPSLPGSVARSGLVLG